MQKDGAGNLSTLYTYGNQRINSESINNISGIYTYDGRGSVSSVIGGFGDYRATYWYDGLGNVIRNLYGAGDSNNRYKPYYGYNAEQYNPVTGNQNLRARQLNIRRQRFLTEDNYLGNKTDTLSINRYIYGNGNPLKYKDPSGNIAWFAIAGIAAGLAALGAGIYTGVTTGSWEEGLKAGATVGLAVGVGVATVGLVTAGSVTVGAGVVVKGVLASTQVVTAAGAGTGAILATSAMAGTATYKAGQKFIQRKNVGLGEAVNSVASAGYAGYNIGNAISLGSTYINSKTGAIDSWIGSLDSATNTSNTYHYGDITKNAGYVNPYGTSGRLNQDMAVATANSVSGGCEKAPVDYRESNIIKDKADFYVVPSGEIYKYGDYPKDDGALGSWETTKLRPGTIVDRYGDSTGKFLAPVNTPIEQRSLPPWTNFNEYHQYEVLKEYNFASSVIAPYYNQSGGGIQYKSDVRISELLKDGIIKEIGGN